MDYPDFDKYPLIPVITQDADSHQVLMLAYMNHAAFEETLKTRQVCYFSRSRQELWRKGETSGHTQDLIRCFYDCDSDAILVQVKQHGGAACHEGYASCFFREIDPDSKTTTVIADRVFDPATVYGSK